MRFLSVRDLRNPSRFLRELAQQKDLVLTVNGKPIAVLLRVERGDLEETVRTVRQARVQRAVTRILGKAAEGGRTSKLSSAIDAEIRAVRSKRKRL